MKITVVGTGYVGLVAGACFAEFGQKVVCVDYDRQKISQLNAGEVPIFEDGLEDLLTRNVAAGRLSFSHDLPVAVPGSDVAVIAVGTPGKSGGETDLEHFHRAISDVLANIDSRLILVIKSTVPMGTAARTREWVKQITNPDQRIDIVSNPEFLRQGSAVNDFLNPDRIIIGGDSRHALRLMREVYGPLEKRNIPVVLTSNETAEMIKYAANTFLALKISYINEIANMCDHFGADVTKVAEALGMDSRIGPSFLEAGPGFGGSCLPKDVKSFVNSSKKRGYTFRLGKAIISANAYQRRAVVAKVKSLLGSLRGKRIAILGLAFKANTDDVRESPAMYVIKRLHHSGAKVRAYDPAASAPARREVPRIQYVNDAYAACDGADIAVLLTAWDEFRNLDFSRIHQSMAQPIIYDTRNALNRDQLGKLGFVYFATGRATLGDAKQHVETVAAVARKKRKAKPARKRGPAIAGIN